MAESLKRGLRERSRKRNFDSDDGDGQLYPYAKTYSKEFINPSQQLNSDAKLLIKFINAANRSYADALLLKQKQNQTAKTAQTHQNKPHKKDEHSKEPPKKNQEPPKNAETESNRKGKQINSNNGLNKTYQKLNNNKAEDFLTKIKGMALASASSMLELEKTLGKTSANVPPKKAAQSSTPKSKPDASSYFVVKAKQKNGGGQKQEKPPNKFQLTEQKIFKRSAFHVAIAYHIFLSQKGRTAALDANSYDPTYPARKLKEQMARRPQ